MEMVVTVAIIGILTGVSVGMMGPQIGYFRGRTSAEQVASMIKHAQYLARSTHITPGDVGIGNLVGPSPGNPLGTIPNYGVAIFAPPTNSDGYRLLVWRENDPNLHLPMPGALTVPPVNSPQFTYLVELPMETVLTPAVDSGIPLNSCRIAFGPDGRIDLARSVLGNLVAVNPGNPDFINYTFDIQNPDVGYCRVRIHTDGTVEQSAHMPLGPAPVTQGGGQF